MALRLSIDPGAEYLLPFAKKKLAELKRFGRTHKVIEVDTGERIYAQSGFVDSIRIEGASEIIVAAEPVERGDATIETHAINDAFVTGGRFVLGPRPSNYPYRLLAAALAAKRYDLAWLLLNKFFNYGSAYLRSGWETSSTGIGFLLVSPSRLDPIGTDNIVGTGTSVSFDITSLVEPFFSEFTFPVSTSFLDLPEDESDLSAGYLLFPWEGLGAYDRHILPPPGHVTLYRWPGLSIPTEAQVYDPLRDTELYSNYVRLNAAVAYQMAPAFPDPVYIVRESSSVVTYIERVCVRTSTGLSLVSTRELETAASPAVRTATGSWRPPSGYATGTAPPYVTRSAATIPARLNVAGNNFSAGGITYTPSDMAIINGNYVMYDTPFDHIGASFHVTGGISELLSSGALLGEFEDRVLGRTLRLDSSGETVLRDVAGATLQRWSSSQIPTSGTAIVVPEFSGAVNIFTDEYGAYYEYITTMRLRYVPDYAPPSPVDSIPHPAFLYNFAVENPLFSVYRLRTGDFVLGFRRPGFTLADVEAAIAAYLASPTSTTFSQLEARVIVVSYGLSALLALRIIAHGNEGRHFFLV